MSKVACQGICNDCPFRRTALRGWLGDNNPEDFVTAALSDPSVPCHQTVEWNAPDWREAADRAPRCRGALVLRANTHKRPRDAEAKALQDTIEPDREQVFSHAGEFVEYHRTGDVRSWELPDG